MIQKLAGFLFGWVLFFGAVSSCFAQGRSIQEAAAEVEAAIQSTLSQAGQVGQPSLRQLGGVEAGSTESEGASNPEGKSGANQSGGGG